MSFLSVLETIGKDVEAGIALAEPIVGAFVPVAGPILMDIAANINELESAGVKVTSSAALTSIVSALATVQTVKQHAAAQSAQTAAAQKTAA